MINLSENIISTIVYYDVLDYPLTAFEIWKYLLACNAKRVMCNDAEEKKDGYSLFEIVRGLDSDEVKKQIEEKNGFYFLKGRGDLVEKRLEKNKISEKKFKLIRQAVFWLKLCPFVRMIAITGTTAMKNAERKSDLDFLVVIRKNRIFVGRTAITLLSHLLGLRRHGKKITDRICLNCFLTEDNLDFPFQDLFSSSEYSFIFPLFGEEVFGRFQEANRWIKNYRPNFQLENVPNLKFLEDSKVSCRTRQILEAIFDSRFLEETLGKWQLSRIEKDPRTRRPGSAVLASCRALIFLPKPQGPRVFERFRNNLEKLEAAK